MINFNKEFIQKKVNLFLKSNYIIYILIIIIVVLLLILFFGLNWITFLWKILNGSFISTTAGTLLGVWIAFSLAIYSDKKIKEHTYGVIADQIAFEWISNLTYAKNILNSLESGYATVLRFNRSMAESALNGSYLYEFAPREFINKLRIYNENIIIVNKLMEYYFINKSNTQEDIDKLKKQINIISILIDEIGKTPIR